MTGSLSTKERGDGASSQCLGSLPGRLTIVGGFVLLGWFALAIAGATHAAASPGSTEPHQVPTISSLLRGSPSASTHTGSPADPAARVVGALRHPARSTMPRPAIAHITPAGHTKAYGAALVPLPVDHSGASRPRSDPNPSRAGPVASAVDETSVLDDLPVVDGLAPAIEHVVDPVLKPVEAAAAPVLAPAAGLLAPVDQVVTQLGTAVRPASSTVDALLAPVTTPVDTAVAQVAQPVSNLATELGATAGILRAVSSSGLAPPVASPGPPAPVDGSPVGYGETGVLPAPPDDSASVLWPTGSDSVAGDAESTSGSIRPTASAAPVSAASWQLDRARVPAPPWPTIPPSAPELLAIASAPGGAAASNSGSGGTALPGFNTGESWAAQQLHRIGVVDSGGSRPVRNSAMKPPVWPD